MKKLELKFGRLKEMLTKEQMQMISGGYFPCNAIPGDGFGGASLRMDANNCCQAQAMCDTLSYSNSYSDLIPNGCDCPCDEDCN